MANELDPEVGAKAIQNFFDLWISPEIERRRTTGALPESFVLHGAQVIFTIDSSLPQVRLNNEVRAIVHVKPSKGELQVGEPVMADDIDEIGSIELTDHDPDASHLTVIFLKGKTYCSFNFHYNATRVAQTLEAVQEFMESAEAALSRVHLRAFVENLWSATELLAKAYLLWNPDANVLSSTTHSYIHSQFNLSGKTGNVATRWVELLNTITHLRRPARYLSGPLPLTMESAKQMLVDAKDLFEHVRTNNPPRHKTHGVK